MRPRRKKGVKSRPFPAERKDVNRRIPNPLFLIALAALPARAEVCGPNARIRDLKPGAVLTLEQPLKTGAKSRYRYGESGPYAYHPYFVAGAPKDASSALSSSTQLDFPAASVRVGADGSAVLPPFRCTLARPPERESRHLGRTTGAAGPANTGSLSATVLMFESAKDCPLTKLVARHSGAVGGITFRSGLLRDLLDDLTDKRDPKKPAVFTIRGECWNPAERRRYANEQGTKTLIANSRLPSEKPVQGIACYGDESVRDLNPGSVITLQNPIPLDEDDQLTIGIDRNHYGVSIVDRKPVRYGHAFGPSVDLRVGGGNTLVRDGKRRIPPFRCVLDAKPVSESDFFRRSQTNIGEASATYFQFKRTPECPIEFFVARRTAIHLGWGPSSVASLKETLGANFEIDATCGAPLSLPKSAKTFDPTKIETRALPKPPTDHPGPARDRAHPSSGGRNSNAAD